jgi:mannose-6-phosphate isomerase-like protein (cupin superfamily)
MSAYQATHFSQIDVIEDGRVPMRAVRHHFGITTFGVNVFTAKEAGERLINEHDEADVEKEELYLVLEGRARFQLDGEELDAPTGTFVYARPEVRRTAFAEEAGTTLVAMGGGAFGKPYEVEGWELWAPMMGLYHAGKYGEAADWVLGQIAAGQEPGALTFYNLACAESLAGRHQDALDHLARAIELRDDFRPMAAGDSDFDPIREEPEFRSLVPPASD